MFEVSGIYYDTYEEAYENALELVDKYELFDAFLERVSLSKIVDWCFSNEEFFTAFEDDLLEAEKTVIEEYYLFEYDDEDLERIEVYNEQILN